MPSCNGTITFNCNCGKVTLLYHGSTSAVQFAHLATALKQASNHTCKKGK